MKRIVFILALAVLVVGLAAPVCFAGKGAVQNIDVGSITCEQFINDIASADEEAIGYIFMWLDGYLSGLTGDTVIDWNNLAVFSEQMVDYCDRFPRVNILKASKQVGIQ